MFKHKRLIIKINLIIKKMKFNNFMINKLIKLKV